MKIFQRVVLVLAGTCIATALALAQQLQVPESIAAGSELQIRTAGQGSGTLYVVGPGAAIKREVQLGSEISIVAEQLEQAGRYVAILRAGGQTDEHAFWINPSSPAELAFLA